MKMQGYADVINHIIVLRKQEETTYKCFDYLSPEFQQQQALQEDAMKNCLGRIRPNATFMDETWREKICEWAYNIVDYFNYDRTLVFICMNYLDRYAMKRRVDTKTYQLAAMTALFLVVKTYESRSSSRILDVRSLAKLSQSTFSENSIIAMEMEMLQMLEWNLFPPTAHTFAMNLNNILLAIIYSIKDCPKPSLNARQEVTELSRFLTELSVCDYFFVTQHPSTVAIASLLIAVEVVGQDEYDPSLIQIFLQRLYHETRLNGYSPEVQECKARLRSTYEEGGFSKPVHEIPCDAAMQDSSNRDEDEETVKEDDSDSLNYIPSPVCVSGVNN